MDAQSFSRFFQSLKWYINTKFAEKKSYIHDYRNWVCVADESWETHCCHMWKVRNREFGDKVPTNIKSFCEIWEGMFCVCVTYVNRFHDEDFKTLVFLVTIWYGAYVREHTLHWGVQYSVAYTTSSSCGTALE